MPSGNLTLANLYYPGINDAKGGDPTGAPFDPSSMTLFAAWLDPAPATTQEYLRRDAARSKIAAGEQIFNPNRRVLYQRSWPSADHRKVQRLVSHKSTDLRGFAARAPYFHNGAASDLSQLVNFYIERFQIGLTPEQKSDLVAFLSAL